MKRPTSSWRSGWSTRCKDRERFLGQVTALLKPEGRFLLVEPHFHVRERVFDVTLEEAKTAGLRLDRCARDRIEQVRPLCAAPLAFLLTSFQPLYDNSRCSEDRFRPSWRRSGPCWRSKEITLSKQRLIYNAAKVLAGLDDLDSLIAQGRVREIKGIGETLSAKIIEYHETGKMAYHEELKKRLPVTLIELLQVPNLGVAEDQGAL